MAHEHDGPHKITKVFIGGLKDLTEDDLRTHFSKYGEFKTVGRDNKPMTGIELIKDQTTQAPKFAFLHYLNVADCDSCIKASPHYINNVKLMPRLAVNKDLNNSLRQCEKEGQSGKLKVFVGGLPGSADEEMVKAALQNHFACLKVQKVIIKKVKETQKPRGFGFITLEDDHEVAKACEIRHFIIDGKQVECKLAPDNNQGQGGNFQGGGRGRGADRGGYGGYGGQGGRGGRGGSSGGWGQQESYGSTQGGYGTSYESWGNEGGYDDASYYSQDSYGYSAPSGNGYDAYSGYEPAAYGQSSNGSDYYGSSADQGYGQSSGYGGSRGGRGSRGGAGGGYGGGRGAAPRAGGRGAARGGRGAPRPHPYQQQY